MRGIFPLPHSSAARCVEVGYSLADAAETACFSLDERERPPVPLHRVTGFLSFLSLCSLFL